MATRLRPLPACLIVSLLVLPGFAAEPAPPPASNPEQHAAQDESGPAESEQPKDPNAAVETAKPGPVKRPARKPAQPGTTDAAPAGSGGGALPRARGPLELRETKDPKSGQGVLVISNADLERIYGPPTISAPAPEAGMRPRGANEPAPHDPAQAGAADPTQRIAALEVELQRLRANALRLSNPLLGVPVQTKEEQEKMRGQDNAQRLAQTNQQIQQLEAELNSLRSGSGAKPD